MIKSTIRRKIKLKIINLLSFKKCNGGCKEDSPHSHDITTFGEWYYIERNK